MKHGVALHTFGHNTKILNNKVTQKKLNSLKFKFFSQVISPNPLFYVHVKLQTSRGISNSHRKPSKYFQSLLLEQAHFICSRLYVCSLCHVHII